MVTAGTTASPTTSPTNLNCENTPGTFIFQGDKVSCVDLLSLDESDFNDRCKKSKYVDNCPANCNPQCATQSPTPSPSQCEDKSKKFKINIEGTLKTKDCDWLASLAKIKKKREYCKTKVEINGKQKKLPTICKKTCGELGKGECGFLKG